MIILHSLKWHLHRKQNKWGSEWRKHHFITCVISLFYNYKSKVLRTVGKCNRILTLDGENQKAEGQNVLAQKYLRLCDCSA